MLTLYAVASVSNGYFAQPLLGTLTRDSTLNGVWVGGIGGATQAGCMLALLLIVPLGDRRPRRQVLLVQLVPLTPMLLAVGLVQIHQSLLFGMLSIGLFGAATTQGLIVCVVVLAPLPEHGHVAGTIRDGVVIGPLLVHALTGWIAEVVGWHAAYTTPVGFSVAMLCMSWCALPTLPTVLSPPKHIALPRLMW